MPQTVVNLKEIVSIPLTPEDLVIGKPIPWSVYDENQHLLLRRGFVISSQRQLDTLFKRGIRRLINESNKEVKENFGSKGKFHAFEVLEILVERLGSAFKALEGESRRFFPFQIAKIALDIQSICLDDPDPLLAALLLDINGDYQRNKPLHDAVLCELLAKRMGVSQMHRLSLVSAALSHDIMSEDEMFGLDTLGVLSETQWVNVKDHPNRSYRMLIQAGVTDDVWLNCVVHHHERNDGTGYPHGLTQEQTHLTTRILHVCDIYTAMLRNRPYRDALKPKSAMKELLKCSPTQIDSDITRIFMERIGYYPPGCIVRLKTGEIGVVTGRSENIDEPELMAISNGVEHYPSPKKVSAAEAGILAAMPVKVLDNISVDIAKLWPLMQPISVS